MKKSKYSEEQIIGILREAEGDTPVKAVCARHNISEATFYKWRAKYGGLEVNEARRLRSLEEENSRLKRLVADQAVQILGGSDHLIAGNGSDDILTIATRTFVGPGEVMAYPEPT